jgi:hypothetical protein
MDSIFKNSGDIQNVGILPNVSFLTTLRNSGYNNYTAIADIVDNSLDNEVDAKNVWVTIKTTKFIQVVDNGSGMNFETLNEALKLGSKTGKDATIDLGSYGTGLKGAFLSMGKKLIVKTKREDGNFLIGVFDYDEMVNENIWYAPIGIGSDDEYEKFKELTGTDHGTIIEISNLDRISNTNPTIFKDTLKKKFSLFYKYIIDEKNVNIYINGEKVESFDPMYRNESWSKRLSDLNETFEFENKTYRFNAYYLEPQSGKFSETIERNQAKAGLYIYRNYRLVGDGLGLGVIDKFGDGYLNGYRVELFVDGSVDVLFGSTFLKMVTEKDKNDINQGFKDKLRDALNKYTNTARNLSKFKENNSTDNDVNIDDTMNKSLIEINKSKLLKVKSTNEKRGEHAPEVKEPGKNKFSERHREFAKWDRIDLGEAGNICKFGREGGKHVIYWNTSHIFWKEFLSKYAKSGNGEVVGVINKLFVAMALAQEEKLNYYENSELAAMIDEYQLQMSESLRKLMNNFI